MSHIPVLTQELLAFFGPVSLKIMVDGTTGAGGHAEALLKAHPEIEQYIAIDQDPVALKIAQERLKGWDKVTFVQANFSQLGQILGSLQVDGVLLDLGVSSMQLDQPERGFSFMQEAPLDMRMDPTQELTAHEIVNLWDEREIGRILRDYGEEKRWRAAAHAIVEGRPIETTRDLVELLTPVLKQHKKNIHPLTLVFQGLRIAVNGELEALQKVLPLIIQSLHPGGRCAVISFHSLEDRIVKQFFAKEALDKADTTGLAGLFQTVTPQVQLLTRKPVVANEQEVQNNPRSRSAKLRVVEKR